MKTETLESRLLKRIARKRGDVFLRADFDDLGGYDQVGRALRDLVRKERLLKLGYGIYTRAAKSPFTDKPVPPKGLETLTEALHRLGIETAPTRLQQAHSDGRTTQVPTGRVIGVRRRVRRKIGYDGVLLSFERAGDLASRPATGDNRAVSAFLEKLRGTYDVSQTIMFGSRARGDNRPDSDLDLAVVLNGKRRDFIDTKLDMAGLAFDVLMETGVLVQAFPMWEDDLAHPEQFPNPALIRNIAREGIRLG